MHRAGERSYGNDWSLRPGYIQIRVLDLDAALVHYIDRIGLNLVGRGNDGRVYLKGWDEFDRHSIVLRLADKPGMDFAGFKVAADRDLNTFGSRIRDAGIPVEEIPEGDLPGTGRRLRFTIPSGHCIELYAQMELSPDAPSTRNPDVWPDDPRGMRASRFDHFLLYGPDVDGVTRFFTEVLDFSLAEKIDTPDGTLAVWLTCSNKAHDIAFVKQSIPASFTMSPFCWSLGTTSAMRRTSSLATTSHSTSDRRGTASRAARPSTSSIPRAIATKSSPAATAIIPTTQPGYGQRTRSARASSITRRS